MFIQHSKIVLQCVSRARGLVPLCLRGSHASLRWNCVAHVLLVSWKAGVLYVNIVCWFAVMIAVDWALHKAWPHVTFYCRRAGLSCTCGIVLRFFKRNLPYQGLNFLVWYLLLLNKLFWLNSWARSGSDFDFCISKLASIRVHPLLLGIQLVGACLFSGVTFVGRVSHSRF